MGPICLFLLRGLGKFLAVVLASAVVGAGLGIGLSNLSGGEAADGSAPVATAPVADPSATTGATGASGTTGPDEPEPQAPRLRVLASTFAPATTPSGLPRRRARVAVRLRVTARYDEATPGTARLISGDDQLKSDPNAEKAADDLLAPIPPPARASRASCASRRPAHSPTGSPTRSARRSGSATAR